MSRVVTENFCAKSADALFEKSRAADAVSRGLPRATVDSSETCARKETLVDGGKELLSPQWKCLTDLDVWQPSNYKPQLKT
jgi:hypothetical protein